MRPFRIRTDIERAVLGGFALPLGFEPEPSRAARAPTEGYTVEYTPGEEDEPDAYAIYAVASHERLAPIVEQVFRLLPRRVYAIVEIGSRDAYRSLDVYMSPEPITSREFLEGWKAYQAFILEDGSVGCGANSEDPFVEIFLDQWKGLSVHVPLLMRDDVERILGECGLREVAETWPPLDEDEANEALRVRPVLAVEDEYSPGVEEMLLELRRVWKLELNVDPETNVDESGRPLGSTLWHAMVIVDPVRAGGESTYASIWATAGSLAQMEQLIDEALADHEEWRFAEIYTIDRVAFDERPEALGDLPPRRRKAGVHLLEFEA